MTLTSKILKRPSPPPPTKPAFHFSLIIIKPSDLLACRYLIMMDGYGEMVDDDFNKLRLRDLLDVVVVL